LGSPDQPSNPQIGTRSQAHALGEPKPFDELARADLPKNILDVPKALADSYHRVGDVANASYQQHVIKPVEKFVQKKAIEPLEAIRKREVQRFLNSPQGEQFVSAVEMLTAEKQRIDQWLTSTPVGKAFDASLGKIVPLLNEKVVTNPQFWDALDTTTRNVRKGVELSGVATLAAIAVAAQNGTLIQGVAIAGDKSATREAKEVAAALNFPKGSQYRYWYAQIPGVPGGRVFVAASIKLGVFIPPGTTPGSAVPWIGAKDNPGNPGKKEIVGTASAIAAGADGEIGFSAGTENFNVTQKRFGVLGRLAANVPRAELRAPGESQNTFDLRAIFAADWAHIGSTTTLNFGSGAIVVGRQRHPISEKAELGTLRNWVDPTGRGRSGNFSPVFNAGSTTYNPNGEDLKAIRRFLGLSEPRQ
jgi:hypothetical protein